MDDKEYTCIDKSLATRAEAEFPFVSISRNVKSPQTGFNPVPGMLYFNLRSLLTV